MENIIGNSEIYSIKNVKPFENSPIKGKRICFLGSSVTFGSASEGESFADFIAARNGLYFEKYAVNGTTLVDNGESSYIARMKKIPVSKFDLFVCQLSTNDAAKGLEIGDFSDVGENTTTVCGAIKYIISYVSENFGCPVAFYTNAYYENQNYSEMVEKLSSYCKANPETGLIDLYTDAEFNSISPESRALYMKDRVHPTKAGYLEWWTPRMEKDVFEILK